MDRSLINALISRKAELIKELDNINSILSIYTKDSNIFNDTQIKQKPSSTETIVSSENLSVKDKILKIIKDLGGSVYVNELVTEMQKLYPQKDPKSISNQARNHLHILKSEGKLRSELKDNNKWQYHII